MNNLFARKNLTGVLALFLALVIAGFFIFALSPANSQGKPVVFEVQKGEGFRQIVDSLYGAGLIRSRPAFELFALLGGKAFSLRPGLYRLSSAMGSAEIVRTIGGKSAGEAAVTIPEGANIYDIDRILSNALIFRPGALISYAKTVPGGLEGHLFPDTYDFYTNADPAKVVAELTSNFDAKAAPLLNADKRDFVRNLTLASILEKEVTDPEDRKLVAGILLKRAATGMTLNVDATVCYAKFVASGSSDGGCYPLTPVDFKLRSPYNTYSIQGFPPAPIGNPGIDAIAAALHPVASPYWYYLSDPKSGKTIFAKTLDEQNSNRVKYLVR